MGKKRKTYDYGTANLVGEYGYENKQNTVVKSYKKMGKKKYGTYKPKKKDYKLQNLEKKVKAMETAKEKKHHETTITSSAIAAGSMQMVSNVGDGSNEGARIGVKVKMYSIQCSGHIILSTDNVSQSGRIIIFIDHDQNGVLPAITDMWLDVASFNSGKPRNKTSGLSESFRRFTIVYDHPYNINPSGGGVGISFNSSDVLTTTILEFSTRQIIPKFYEKMYHYINYKGTGTDIAKQGDGAIFVFSSVSNDDTVLVDASIMIKYTDD